MSKKVIGLVGPISSGIWVVFDLLKENGFVYYRLSDHIREEALKRNIPDSRENWRKVGDDLREKYGADILAKRTVDIIRSENNEKIIIDSIRHPSEIEYLKKEFGEDFLLIGMTAPVEVRFELMKLRKRGIDPMGFEEFKKLDDYEHSNDGDQTRQNIKESLSLMDILFEHNGDLSKLKEQIQSRLIEKLII